MSVFAKKCQLVEAPSIARKGDTGFAVRASASTYAVWLSVLGPVCVFGLGRDFERPKVLCLALAATFLLPRALLMWPSLPRNLQRAVLFWLMCLSASTVLALDPARALIGSFERSQGALVLFFCTILALARVPLAVLLPPVSVAACISGGWAILQFTGLEAIVLNLAGVFNWAGLAAGWDAAFGWRVFAGFGNPTALGGWLVLALPVLIFNRQKNVHAKVAAADPTPTGHFKPYLGLAAILLATAALILSGTRAAWLALVIIALVFWRRHRAVRLSALLALAVVLVALALRLESVKSRTELLRAVLQVSTVTMIQNGMRDGAGVPDPYPGARVLLGVGTDLQAAVLLRTWAGNGHGEVPDRVHQMLVDGILSIGLLGSAGWLWLMLALWRERSSTQRGALLALIAAVIVWQFGFALTAEKTLFALLLGSMFAATPTDLADQTTRQSNPSAIASFHAQPILAGLLSAAMALFVLLSFLPKCWIDLDRVAPWRTPERAIVQFERARAAISLRQGEVALIALGRAVQLDPYRDDLARARTQLALELGHNTP